MNDSDSNSNAGFGRVAIVGVGLIGGSIAAALRQRGLVDAVLGIGRTESRLQQAQQAGLVDEYTTSHAGVADCDLMIVCTPVDHIAEDVQELAAAAPQAILTDAGSTKRMICETMNQEMRFVGSHPIAGSEKSGFEHARADLFDGRVCVVTPTKDTTDDVEQTVTRFWEAIGMRVVRMSPQAHDEALAVTSHVPHVVAAALSSLLREADVPLTGTGFADTTRIAAGDPQLWTAILLQNRASVVRRVRELEERLRELRVFIEAEDTARVTAELTQAKKIRDALAER